MDPSRPGPSSPVVIHNDDDDENQTVTKTPSYSPTKPCSPTTSQTLSTFPTSTWVIPDDSSSCGLFVPGSLHFELNLTTDAFGMDTSFEVVDRSSGTAVVSNGTFASNRTFQFTECLDPKGCYDFVIKDDWDDGICCLQGDGSYNVSVNGGVVGGGREFGSSETVFLGGSCGVNSTE